MVEIYCDAASLKDMERFATDPRIAGFTTNPSLMKKAGIRDYRGFARTVLAIIGDKPVSFEVLADDFPTMEKQAREIASWGENVHVKVPITNTLGVSCAELVGRLDGVNVNITAVMTEKQLKSIEHVVRENDIVSIFAGRIADTGTYPPIAEFHCPSIWKKCRMLWASTREVYSVGAAYCYGYHIITLTPELIAKLPLRGKDLTEYSLETVRQFHEDGKGIEF